MQQYLKQIWIPLENPGYLGAKKHDLKQKMDARFGPGHWRFGHYVRGHIVSVQEAIIEYEQSYRVHLRRNPEIVHFLVNQCGNVYDFEPANVHDDAYIQPHTERNHYQDIAIRRVIAELVDDGNWPDVAATDREITELTDLSDGQVHRLPRAFGFRGDHLLEIRGPDSAGFMLNPAVVPVHDPLLVIPNPQAQGWFLDEGCGHLSVEAFWQFSKVIEVRYDRLLKSSVASLG